MKVVIDSNVLFSALYRSGSISHKAYIKAINSPFQGLVCDRSFNELRESFLEKFPDMLNALEWFINMTQITVETISVPEGIHSDEVKIRDSDDALIFRAAVFAGADIILTGDLDLLENGIVFPLIMKPDQFLLYRSVWIMCN